jgi:hypothetical protein
MEQMREKTGVIVAAWPPLPALLYQSNKAIIAIFYIAAYAH